jgi:hypothetical protein
MAPAGSSRHASARVYPSTTQVSCVCVAEVATARSPSAVFNAVIDATTGATPMQATVSVQARARGLPPMLTASVRWSGPDKDFDHMRLLSAA